MFKLKAGLLFALFLHSTSCGAGAGTHTGHTGDEHSAHAGHSAQGAGSAQAGHGNHEIGAADVQTRAEWQFEPAPPQAEQETAVSISIQDEQGKPVEKFEVTHEKLMHLIVVSRDLSYFDHIHPEYLEGGRFRVTTKLPAGGDYKLFADFRPADGAVTTQSQWVTAQGAAAAAQNLVTDTSMTKQVEGKEITLSIDRLAPGKESTLSFRIRDAASGQDITNLEPYLGAVGHVVILDAAAEHYLHVHPVNEGASGPVAEFLTEFPQSGLFKIWGQFQHEGRVFTVPFVVKVS